MTFNSAYDLQTLADKETLDKFIHGKPEKKEATSKNV